MIRVDLWGGDLHQNLIQSRDLETWAEACSLIQEAVEAGLLANVLHLDFRAPAERLDQQRELLRKYLK